MADENKILDRVRKLLALANDDAATEGERDNALRMAHATLMKHQLTLEYLDAFEREKEDPRGRMDVEGWNLVWCRTLRGTIARMFFCRYIIGGKINATRGRHIYVGRSSNTATAAYMSEWIIKSILKEADRAFGHRLTPKGREFCIGATEKLEERVKEILLASQQQVREAGSALVVVDLMRTENDANKEWLANNLRTKKTNLTQKRNANSEAYNAGREYGGKINLNKQIATTAEPRRLK